MFDSIQDATSLSLRVSTFFSSCDDIGRKTKQITRFFYEKLSISSPSRLPFVILYIYI